MDTFMLAFFTGWVIFWLATLCYVGWLATKPQEPTPEPKAVFVPRSTPPEHADILHKSWYINGAEYQEKLPEPSFTQKIVTPERTEYRKGGKLHRNNGPAIIYADGSKEWWLNGERHRKGGPAILTTDGIERYFICGAEYPKPE